MTASGQAGAQEAPARAARPFRIVCKYGGTSLASLAKMRAVARELAVRRRRGEQVVVVCSAMGQSTNALLARARALGAQPPARELDMLLSCGERTSVALMAMALWAEGVPAISLTGSQAGIVTDEVAQNGKIVAVHPQRILAGLTAGQVVVVAGFQGVSRLGEITTLGRGGSDATAVALGAALQADETVLYSDVDGVYSADPRLLPDARHLTELSYEQMHLLSLGGAKVVYGQAVRLAEALGVEILARAAHGVAGAATAGPGLRLRGAQQTRIGGGKKSANLLPAGGTGQVRPILALHPLAYLVTAADGPSLWRLAGQLQGAGQGPLHLACLCHDRGLWLPVAEAPAAPVAAALAEAHAAAQGLLHALLLASDAALPRARQVAWLTALGPGVLALDGADLLRWSALLTAAGLSVLHLQKSARALELAVPVSQGRRALAALHDL